MVLYHVIYWGRRNFDLVVGGSTGVGDQKEANLHENFTRLVRVRAGLEKEGGATANVASETDAGSQQQTRPSQLGLRELRKLTSANQYATLALLHQNVEATVTDPTTAEQLKPWYLLGCKRPVLHPGFLPAFNRSNVRLVSSGLKSVSGSTVTSDNGETAELDVLIFATGFEVGNLAIYNRVEGVGGQLLESKVGGTVASTVESRTFLGVHSRGFPNLLLMQGPQSVRPFNMTSLLEQQSVYFARVVQFCRKHRVQSMQPTVEAEARWLAQILKSNNGTDQSTEHPIILKILQY